MIERKQGLWFLIGGVLAVCLLVATFQLGVMIGYRKARFSYRWGEEYHHNFGGRGSFFGGHGTSGRVLSVQGNEILMRGEDGIERVVVVTEHTKILRARRPAKNEDIQANTRIVVIGRPTEQAKLEAAFIRLF